MEEKINFPYSFTILKRFRDEGKFCDINICIADKIFPCHRNVLASSSQYFEKVFSQDDKAESITLDNTDIATFTEILNFIYSGRISVTEQNADKILSLAVYLALNNLEQLCNTFIENDLPLSHIFEICQYAESSNKKSFLNKLVKNIAENFDKLSRGDAGLGNISSRLMGLILSHEKLQCDPENAVKEVVGWMKRHNEVTNCDEDNENKFNPFDKLKIIYAKLVSFGYRHVEKFDHEKSEWKCTDVYRRLRNHKTIKFKNHKYRLVNGYFGGANNINKFYIVIDDMEISLQRFPVDANNYHLVAGDDLLYVSVIDGGFGGWDNLTRNLDIYKRRYSIYSYIPVIDQWFSIPETYNKFSDRCISIIDNILYVCGGKADYQGPLTSQTSVAKFYDHRENKWNKLPDLLLEHVDAAACSYDGKIFVSGGHALTCTEVLDPVAGKWRKLKSMNYNRKNHVMVPYNDLLYVFGDLFVPFETYNPKTNQWITGPMFDKKLVHRKDKFPYTGYALDVVFEC